MTWSELWPGHRERKGVCPRRKRRRGGLPARKDLEDHKMVSAPIPENSISRTMFLDIVDPHDVFSAHMKFGIVI